MRVRNACSGLNLSNRRSNGKIPGGGRNSHTKQTGMFVVSLRGVNSGFFFVSLRVFRAKREYFMPPRSRLGFREERRATFFDDYVFISLNSLHVVFVCF